jgi:lipopolysaccharide transport system permease protein
MPIIIILILWSKINLTHFNIWYFYTLICLFISSFFCAYILATICARFRDLIQIVNLFFQIIFFVTPVMWFTELMPSMYLKYIYLNPFASFLIALRNPLIGLSIDNQVYLFIGIWTVICTILAYVIYSKFDRKIIYWI